jgi:PAS domain S-box-containing protein
MLGYSEAELCGKSLNVYTHPGDAKLAQDLLEELRTGQRQHYHLEKRYLTKEGETLWARLTAFLVDDDSFGQPFIFGILEDITSHKHKELEMGEMKRSLAEARDNERLMLAQELHDGPVQHLLGVSYQMEALTRRIATRQMLTEKEVGAQPPFLSELELLSAYVIDSVRQLRGLISELRPAGLLELGLTAALEGFVARLEYEQPFPLPAITLALDESGRHMPEPIALCIFRVAQEAIRNAVRHAQATMVSVALQIRAQIVVLRVYDDGRGFEVPANMNELTRQDHFGVAGMIERVHVLNGQCHIISKPGEGTEILVWLEY